FIEKAIPKDMIGKEIECVVEYCKSDYGEINAYSSNLIDGIDVEVTYTTSNICNVFDYKFLYGRPFTQNDVEAVAKKAFITESYAKKMFGKSDAVGEIIKLNSTNYNICGVIADISKVTTLSYSNVWVPVTCDAEYGISTFGETQMLSKFNTIILARSKNDIPKIKMEINKKIKQINSSLKGIKLKNYGQPDTHFYSIFRAHSNSMPKIGENIRSILLTLLSLLLIPTVSLAGIIASGIDNRLEELGIRKAFGASRSRLMIQIIVENLLLTFIGGVLGLFISYIIVWGTAGWLLQIVDFSYDFPIEMDRVLITPIMLFNPIIFIITFIITLVLNLLAVIIPAAIVLHKNIIYSLTADKK
ncbi:MAG: FtsX-like permease family protein, partial [Bacteroidales bacterium]